MQTSGLGAGVDIARRTSRSSVREVVEQHLSFGITVIAVETSVVNVNATTGTWESLKGAGP